MSPRVVAAALLVCTLPPSAAVAAERSFGYAWQSGTLGQGGTEMNGWVSAGFGRVDPYSRGEFRAGAGKGVTSWLDAHVFVDADVFSIGKLSTPAIEARLTTVWKAKLLDPVTDAVGFSILGALRMRFDQFNDESLSGELRLILDRQVGAFDFALNAAATFDARWLRLEQNLGLGYRLPNGFLVGLEMRNVASFEQRSYAGDAFFIGPNFAWRGKRFWLAFSFMGQVAAIKAKSQVGGDPLELIDNERFLGRFTVGVPVQ